MIGSTLLANFGARLESTFRSMGQLCLGIDPSAEQLYKWGLDYSANAALLFSEKLLAASLGRVGIVKPQVAFFEQFGASGFQVLEDVCRKASEAGLLVIADAKRGDIGSSMSGYAKAWLEKDAPFMCDAITVTPYLGPESLGKTVEVALENGRGIFILAATSNPEASTLQGSLNAGSSVTQQVIDFAVRFPATGISNIGVVIGATKNLLEMDLGSLSTTKTPILAPGFGVQGARLENLTKVFGTLAKNVICNLGRGIASDSPEGIEARIVSAKIQLEEGLTS